MQDRGIIENLVNALSPDKEQRTQAEQHILSMRNNDFTAFLKTFLEVHCMSETPPQPYQITAGVVLKNSLHSVDGATQNIIEQKWMGLDEEFRNRVWIQLKEKMGCGNVKIAMNSAAILAGIARIEFLKKRKQIFEDIKSGVTSKNLIYVRASYEFAGILATYILEDTQYEFEEESQEIVEFIVINLRQDVSRDVSLSAFKCLSKMVDTLLFALRRIEVTNFLIGAIVNMCSDDDEITVAALESITMILGIYPNETLHTANSILNFLKTLSTTESETVVVQIIEFICCVVEKDKLKSKDSPWIFPFLLKRIEIVDESEEGWNAHKASAYCLELVSIKENVNLIVSDFYYEFIINRIYSEQIMDVKTAFVAIGCGINIEGNISRVMDFVPVLIGRMDNDTIGKSAMWALSKISRIDIKIISPVDAFFGKLISVLKRRNEFSIYATNLLISICTKISTGRNKTWNQQNELNPYFCELIVEIVNSIGAIDINDMGLRNAYFSAANELIMATPGEMLNILDNYLLPFILNRSRELVKFQNDVEKFFIVEGVLGGYAMLIQNIIIVRNEKNIPCMEEIKNLFLQILSTSRQFSVHGDIYITLSALLSSKSFFAQNIPCFVNFIVRDIHSTDFYVAKAVVNLVGDVANSTNQGFLLYSDKIVPAFINVLVDAKTPKKLKPILLSVFGDCALSMGVNFTPYIDMTLQILSQILQLQRKYNEDFVDEVRKNALCMFDCVVISLSYNSRIEGAYYGILEIIKRIIEEDERKVCYHEALQLIVDLKRIYGLKYDLEWIKVFYTICKESGGYESLIDEFDE